MKVLSVLTIITVCSISLSFLAKVQPACAVSASDTNHSFATKQFLPPGTSTVDGQLSPGNVDFFTFSGLEQGKLFDIQVNSTTVDPLLGWLDDSGKVVQDNFGNIEINDNRSANSVLPQLTGIVPASGSLNFGVSGTGDIHYTSDGEHYEITGAHYESGSYTLSLNTFSLPQSSTNPTLINGGFETGNFTGWTTLGENSIETSAFGNGPTQGTFQALLSTGGASFASSILEEFLGLKDKSLDDLGKVTIPPPVDVVLHPTKGSAILQKFEANAGDILTFDWNFLTNESPRPLGISVGDFSFVSISSLSNNLLLSKLADTTDQALASSTPVSSTPFFKESGFRSFPSFTIPTTGTYILGLGVINLGDNFEESGLLVDHVKLTSVPEPTSVLGVLGFGAFLGAGSVLKRKQRQKVAVVKSSR